MNVNPLKYKIGFKIFGILENFYLNKAVEFDLHKGTLQFFSFQRKSRIEKYEAHR